MVPLRPDSLRTGSLPAIFAVISSGPVVTTTGTPTRAQLAQSKVEVIVRGKLGKADVLSADLPCGPAIVKDFAGSPWWARPLGALQIAREARAYRYLEGVPGVPRFFGRIDRHALAIERIDGTQLAFAKAEPGRGVELLAKLRKVVDAIHARGVVHNDLRGRENVLLGRDGEVAVVDFAGAVRLKPGGVLHRVLFPRLKTTDEAAFLKWKGMLAPGTYTAEDRAFLARFERIRALWPFNPKRRRARVGA